MVDIIFAESLQFAALDKLHLSPMEKFRGGTFDCGHFAVRHLNVKFALSSRIISNLSILLPFDGHLTVHWYSNLTVDIPLQIEHKFHRITVIPFDENHSLPVEREHIKNKSTIFCPTGKCLTRERFCREMSIL